MMKKIQESQRKPISHEIELEKQKQFDSAR